jgi:hypothetical protein
MNGADRTKIARNLGRTLLEECKNALCTFQEYTDTAAALRRRTCRSLVYISRGHGHLLSIAHAVIRYALCGQSTAQNDERLHSFLKSQGRAKVGYEESMKRACG